MPGTGGVGALGPRRLSSEPGFAFGEGGAVGVFFFAFFRAKSLSTVACPSTSIASSSRSRDRLREVPRIAMPSPCVEGLELRFVEPVRVEEDDRLKGLGEEVVGLVAANDDGDA